MRDWICPWSSSSGRLMACLGADGKMAYHGLFCLENRANRPKAIGSAKKSLCLKSPPGKKSGAFLSTGESLSSCGLRRINQTKSTSAKRDLSVPGAGRDKEPFEGFFGSSHRFPYSGNPWCICRRVPGSMDGQSPYTGPPCSPM